MNTSLHILSLVPVLYFETHIFTVCLLLLIATYIAVMFALCFTYHVEYSVFCVILCSELFVLLLSSDFVLFIYIVTVFTTWFQYLFYHVCYRLYYIMQKRYVLWIIVKFLGSRTERTKLKNQSKCSAFQSNNKRKRHDSTLY